MYIESISKEAMEDNNMERYEVANDCGSPYAWVIDAVRYNAVPWWRRIFARNSVLVFHGTRAEARAECDRLNSPPTT